VDDERFDHACRMGMLAAAILHWLALGLMIWNEVRPSSASEQSAPVGGSFASILGEFVHFL
jgi:hypothetical protein